MEKIIHDWSHPWEGAVKPFKIFGNLYFIGTVPASTHLIDTGDGLIVIDPGYPQSLYLVVDGIYKLGFDVKDIKYIVISHGHYDHLGAARALCELTGAKTVIGKEDLTYANGKEDLTWARELGAIYYEEFEPDILVSEGDILKLGNTEILFKDAPGHTPGTKAMFFNVTDGEKTLRAAMHGGVGFNTFNKEWLSKNGLDTSIREKFVPAIKTFIDEDVDIFIGNHVGNNDTVGKAEKMTEEFNPFIDKTEWKKFLQARILRYEELIKSEQE